METFIEHLTLGCLYMSGDMGKMMPNGEIWFGSRKDSQVKIKGYRIELGDVESKFLKLGCVREAAVLHSDGRLHGFVSLENKRSIEASFSLVQWRQALLSRGGLGEYALPHSVTVVDTMPRTVSGKIDRRKLALPNAGSCNPQDPDVDEIDPMTSSVETVLLAAFAKCLGRTLASLSCDDGLRANFFEHGGDSSAAGLLVSQLRSCDPVFKSVSVKDLYLNATPLELARVVNSRSRESDSEYVSQDADVEEARRMDEDDNDTRTPNHGNRDLDHNKLDRRDGTMSSMYHGNQIACIQFLYFLFVCLMDGASVRVGIWCLLYSRPWLFSLIGINAEEWGFGLEQPVKMISIHAVLLYCLFYLVANMWFAIWFLILFLAKWRLIGVYTPGLKTSRSWFVRNWIVGRIAASIPWSTVYGTPLGNSMLSMLGAKVGERAYLKIDSRAPIIGGFDCIEIGKDACINHAFVSAISMSPLGVDVGQVRVLDRAVVDPRATLVGHNTLLKDSQLGCLSNMKRGDAIPSGEYWIGSPAAHSRQLQGKKLGYGTYHLLQSVYTFVVHLSIGIPLTFTTAVLLFLSNNWWTPLIFIFFILFHIPWATLIMIVVPALYIKSINHFNDLSAGDYHLYSWPSLLITLKQGLFAVPQGLLNNTFFLVDWMRWCGAKIGQRSEFARVQGAVPDMMAFGDETFLSNWTHVATSEILGGVLRVGGVKVGDRFLAGNRSVIPIKTKMGHNVLLGVLSLAPTDAATTDDITWLGNPAIPLSHPKNDNYPVPKGLEAEARRIWDFIANCIPLTLLGAMSISWFLLAHVFHLKDALFPYVFHSAAAGFVVRISFSFLTAKWLYWYFENGARPSQQDYWSPFNHRWHIYSKTWATFVRPTILIDVEGSWFMNKFLTTTTDMQIGKGSYLACADAFREHDLVRIGTGSVINTFGELRTHTFENWKLKLNMITIGDYCTVGHSSTLMANSMVLDYAHVGPNTFVMKNEVLTKDTYFSGLPAAPTCKSRAALARDDGLPRNGTDHIQTFERRLIDLVLGCMVAVVVVAMLCFMDKPQQRDNIVVDPTATCLTMVGDTMVENGSKDYAAAFLSDPREAFSKVESLLSKCPYVLANLEGPVTSLGMEHDPRQELGGPVNPAYSFNMDPAVVPSLFAEVGITHLGRNNNHLRDRDEGGINDTTQYLEEAGLTSFGFGKTAEEAATPLMLETQYGKVGITGFGDLYNKREVEAGSSVDKSGILPVTKENAALGQRLLLEQGAQIKIAFVHWGENYEQVSKSTRKKAAILAQRGYDLIIGSDGSHTVQEFDYVDNVPVLYNIGNFVFQTPARFEETNSLPYGTVVNIYLDDRGQLSSLSLYCNYVDNRVVDYQPRPCTPSQATTLFSSLGEYTKHMEGAVYATIDLKSTSKVEQRICADDGSGC